MKIVVASNGENMDGKIDERFEFSKYLVIVDMDENTSNTEIIASHECTSSENDLLKLILDNNCEAFITGILNDDFFNILADNGITRFDGRGMTISEAIEKMNNRTIGYFRNVEGKEGCSGEHHHDEPDDHNHEYLH